MSQATVIPLAAAQGRRHAPVPITVVVATRDRCEELEACLHSLLHQTHRPERIVVVDDAPGGAETPAVVAHCDAGRSLVHYVAGPGRGLAAAHNRGLLEVETALVAFTDDDVVADRHWLARVVAAFGSADAVGCVTGRIRPLQLETPAQRWLEDYAGYDKGASRRVYDLGEYRPADPLFPFTAGTLGSGANMAFSMEALGQMRGFDPALGVGTIARGGDDLAAFVDVLQRGYRLVYEPDAIVHHRHARDMAALERQVHGYGVGLTAYLTSCVLRRPRTLATLLRLAPLGARHALSRDSAKNARLAPDYPRRLARIERRGMLAGPVAYVRSRRAQRSRP